MVMEQDKEHGRVFLGKDEATYGKEGTGWIAYDPEYECSGPLGKDSPTRQCPFQTDERHIRDAHPDAQDGHEMSLGGSEGRLFHVGIASFRDPLCPKTLFNMFTKAKHPEKLRVRVIQQNDPEDIDCLEGYCDLMKKHYEATDQNIINFNCPYASNVFIHAVEAKDAKGPTYARSLLSEDIFQAYQENKVSPQDHCLSIDSHMDFEPHFDEKLVDMWDMAQNEYAVLSTYVADIEQLGVNLNGKHEVPHLCMVSFTSSVRTHATKCAQNLSKPKLTNAVYGAGLAMSKCHAELKVPVDPHTPYVFDGEEFNRGARLFTHGYDIYTPNRVYVLHNYHESQSNPKTSSWWKQSRHEALVESNRRLNNLLDILPLVRGGAQVMSDREKLLLRQSRYGLGDRRTLDQLIEFSGIDLRKAKASLDGKNRCGNLQWVPFAEHTNGVNYIPPFDADENPIDDYDDGSIWDQPISHLRHDDPSDAVSQGDGGMDHNLRVAAAQAQQKHVQEPQVNHDPVKTSAERLGESLFAGTDGATSSEKRKLRNSGGDGDIGFFSPDAHNNVNNLDSLLQNGEKSPTSASHLLRPATDSMLVSKQPHAVTELPMAVKCSVFCMVVGMIASLLIALAGKRQRGHKGGGLGGKKQ